MSSDELPQGPEATVRRLTPALRDVLAGLREGLVIADSVHRQYGWSARSDPHLFHHLARREAVERLRHHAGQLDDEPHLGLPMSGLLIRPTPTDVVRVWYSEDAQTKAPDSETGREFVTQPATAPDLFTDFGEPLPMPAVCRTFVRWTAQDTTVTRFTLVRPIGISRGTVVPDWTVELVGGANPLTPSP